MKTLKLFLVAAIAAVMTFAAASVATASGNRFGTLNITSAAQNGTYDAKPVHYRKRYRRYRKYRRRHSLQAALPPIRLLHAAPVQVSPLPAAPLLTGGTATTTGGRLTTATTTARLSISGHPDSGSISATDGPQIANTTKAGRGARPFFSSGRKLPDHGQVM